jgi:hypothetical protein
MWWPGTELNHSASFVISKLLIPQSAQSAYSALIANPVCVLCAVANCPNKAQLFKEVNFRSSLLK